jgi:uncharacterized protein (DUF111 family)
MKKNRPGVMISVLCNASQIPAMEEILFRETTTLGIRRYEVSRHKLRRESVEVETPHGAIRGKLGWIEHRPPTFSPEYDDCARVASAKGIALREVYDAAHAAYKASHTAPEAPAAQPEPIRTSSHDSSPHDSHDHSHDHSH